MIFFFKSSQFISNLFLDRCGGSSSRTFASPMEGLGSSLSRDRFMSFKQVETVPQKCVKKRTPTAQWPWVLSKRQNSLCLHINEIFSIQGRKTREKQSNYICPFYHLNTQQRCLPVNISLVLAYTGYLEAIYNTFLCRGMGRGKFFCGKNILGLKINRLNINRVRRTYLQAYLLDSILNVVQMIFSDGRLDLTSVVGMVLTVCCSVWAALLSWPPLAVIAILLRVDTSYVSICIGFVHIFQINSPLPVQGMGAILKNMLI